MSTHDESLHPRGQAGRWVEKEHGVPGAAAALTPGAGGVDEAAPLCPEERRRAWEIERALLALDDPSVRLDLGNGWEARIDAYAATPDGLVTEGQYTALEFDAPDTDQPDSLVTGAFISTAFANLDERRTAAATIAEEVARASTVQSALFGGDTSEVDTISYDPSRNDTMPDQALTSVARTCGTCQGTGQDPDRYGAAARECSTCGGLGGFASAGPQAVTCLTCRGTGTTTSYREGRASVDTCPVCAGDRLQAPTPPGRPEVFVPGMGRFHRSALADGGYVTDVYAMRFEANRDLSNEEMQRMAQLVGYKWRSTVGGEPVSDPMRDSGRSFIVWADSTKGRGYVEDFEDGLTAFAQEGSPVRTTDRAGSGTKGTRLVDGLDDPFLEISTYYDSPTQGADAGPPA